MRSAAQIKADKKYNEKLKVIACKTTKEKAKELEKIIKDRGYKSFNSYLIQLIKLDTGLDL